MIWFIIGAALGIGRLAWSLVRHPMLVAPSFQEFLLAAVLGALGPGTILWALFTYVLPW